MSGELHSWWTGFGIEVGLEELTLEPAKALASFLQSRRASGARLVSLRQDNQYAAVHFETEVERPQDLANPIRGLEPIAIFFPLDSGQPRVFALRIDFPDVEHQNLTPANSPRSLCIDDRPWPEARLTSNSFDLIRRTQLWLSKAARGELHDAAQPLEPLFFPTSAAMIIPPDVLAEKPNTPVELIGFMRPDNDRVVLTYRVDRVIPQARHLPGFVVLAFQAKPQATIARMRTAPRTLLELADELNRGGVDLIPEVSARLKSWAGISADKLRRLDCRLAIVVAFPTKAADGREGQDTRAFICIPQAGELGVGLEILAKNVGQKGYSPLLIPADNASGMASSVEMAQVYLSFDRNLAAAVAGGMPDRRKVVLIGAGAIGSQVAVDLAREGKFSWSVVDQDYLLPHNLARHALFPEEVAAPKAPALARQLAALLDEPCPSIECNVLNPADGLKQPLTTALESAEIVIDASASVAVSRHLSDLTDTTARRVCIFFNPAGTDAVLLVEDRDRSITLRDLEAQYHRLIQTDPALKGHLAGAGQGLRYSGSCRTLTNRIPATLAALLSAAVARGIVQSVTGEEASIRVWRSNQESEIRTTVVTGRAVESATIGGWKVTYDDGLLERLIALRDERLPSETGGVLLGIADMSRKSIHIAHALPQPEDSQGSVTQFERGVVDLGAIIDDAVQQSMHQLRYVGEWHSHPRRSSMLPSRTDLAQLAWLGRELEIEGLPGLMAIAADRGFAFVAADFSSPTETAGS